jgi:uronate dehydrogenase
MRATWLSYDDLERLVVACLAAPILGFSVIYGLSDNRVKWWDNTGAMHLGYVPRDSSESFRAALEAKQPVLDTTDPGHQLQGGTYVRLGPFE